MFKSVQTLVLSRRILSTIHHDHKWLVTFPKVRSFTKYNPGVELPSERVPLGKQPIFTSSPRLNQVNQNKVEHRHVEKEHLHSCLKEIFPDVVMDYTIPDVVYPETNLLVTFDFYIPSIQLIIEYHSYKHYYWHYVKGLLEPQKSKDHVKQRAIQRLGLKYIVIPYWWNRKSESLASTIHSQFPDLMKDNGKLPIPTKVPPDTYASQQFLPINIMEKVPLMRNIERWQEYINPMNWWMSYQIDGVRAYYDGKGKLYTENGKTINAPSHWITKLPPYALDGELWAGNFEETINLVMGNSGVKEWDKAMYYAFDMPEIYNETYEKRMLRLQEFNSNAYSNYKPVDVIECEGKQHLLRMLEDASRKGFEGVILRKSDAFYFEPSSFFNTKKFDEEDCLVEKVVKERIQCKLLNGNHIEIPYNDKVKENTVISIKYKGLSEDGKPLDPEFVKSRPELNWTELSSSKNQVFYYLDHHGKGKLVCHGCGAEDFTHSKIRIQVSTMFYPPKQAPHVGHISFCVNKECIEKAYEKDSHDQSLFYPPFNGMIGIPNHIKKDLEIELNHVPTKKDLQFVDIDLIQ